MIELICLFLKNWEETREKWKKTRATDAGRRFNETTYVTLQQTISSDLTHVRPICKHHPLSHLHIWSISSESPSFSLTLFHPTNCCFCDFKMNFVYTREQKLSMLMSLYCHICKIALSRYPLMIINYYSFIIAIFS